MTRPLRIEFPGAFYHAMHRGNAGTELFHSRRDRGKFLEYVATAVERFGLRLHSYCLMPNHYHLLIETPQANLSRAMKWINVSYAVYHNRKTGRFGHLFQGRFKAIVVDADEYLTHLSRYIHLNPVRAGMVKHPKAYPWSSYPALGGYVEAPEWLQTEWLLSLFGRKSSRARQSYRDFVESAANQEIENPSDRVIGGLVLGGEDFVNRVRNRVADDDAGLLDQPQAASLTQPLKPDDLMPVICEELGCRRKDILQKGKKRNLARDLAIYLSRELTGESGVALGRYFGGISGSGITMRYKHVMRMARRDRRINRQLERLKAKIMNN